MSLQSTARARTTEARAATDPEIEPRNTLDALKLSEHLTSMVRNWWREGRLNVLIFPGWVDEG